MIMKRLHKTISLVLVLALMLCMCPFASAQDTADEVENYDGFHAPTIKRMIEVNLACGNADEEFFHLLANAYLADPELLIKTILDLPEEDVGYLAKAIAYDLQKTQRQDAVRTDFADPAADVVGRLIALETTDTENASLDVFLDDDMLIDAVTGEMPNADLMMLEEFAGASLSFSASTAEVNSPVIATIFFGSTLAASIQRRYTVKFYKVKDDVTMYCGTTKPIMSPNTMTTTATTQLSFGETGVYQVYAEIYNSAGELFGTSPSVTVTVWGQWHIDVLLPPVRENFGTITLYDASGTVKLTNVCLGKSESGALMDVEFGNTPTGEYIGYLGKHDGSTYSYGPYLVIKTEPISGIGLTSGRTGIWIHGGDPNSDTSSLHYPLRVTHGCVRVTNEVQFQLQETISDLVSEQHHYETGTVSIKQISD